MSKIKVNTLREMARYYTHEKRIGCYEKKQVLENKKKRKKSVKWLCDEIKSPTQENNNKNIEMKNRKKIILKIKKIHPGGLIHIWLMSV